MGPYCNCSKEQVSLERLTQKKFWSALRLCSRWLYVLLALRVLFLSVVVSAGIGFAHNAMGSGSSGDWAPDQLLVQPKTGVPDFVLNRIFTQNGVSLEDTIP